MAQKIIIDPITRIEGHLRIEVELEGNTVKDAWSTITLWRGIETILKGRDPRDAGLMTQRFCGVCTYSHYEACDTGGGRRLWGQTAHERPYREKPHQCISLHNRSHHAFLSPARSGLGGRRFGPGADPRRAEDMARAYSDNPYNASASHYKAVQERLKKFVESGRLGPFANGYWGSPSYKLPAEANLVIVSHYLDALAVSKVGAQMMAIFGGKNPHPQTLVAGGVTSVMDTLDAYRIGEYLFRLKEMKNFVDTAYIPDVLLAATYYKDEGLAGIGGGVKNYLSYGGINLDDDYTTTFFQPGVIKNRDLANVEKLDETKITEDVTHSWYTDGQPLHPYDGTTEPELYRLRRVRTRQGRREVYLVQGAPVRRPSL